MTLITYPYKTKSVELPGNCNITYIDEGKGPQTLLFIHGLANYAPVWKKNIDYLKQYYRCIAIDLPGNGLSDKNEHKFSMEFFADSVFHFVQALALNNPTIAGHSMGGQIALTLALKYPDCTDRLVLCAPAGFEQFSPMEISMYHSALHLIDYISSDENNLRKTIENSFYHHPTQGESIVTELAGILKTYKPNYYKKMIDACITSMLQDSVYGKLSLVKQHTLVIFGKHDALIPNRLIHHLSTEKLAADAVKQMPDAKLYIIPDCGHFVQWEQADKVNELVVAFVG